MSAEQVLPNDPLKFYIGAWMHEHDEETITEIKVDRNDEDGACIWITFVNNIDLPTTLRLEVYEGRLQVHVWNESALKDDSEDPAVIVIAENYDEFMETAKAWPNDPTE